MNLHYEALYMIGCVVLAFNHFPSSVQLQSSLFLDCVNQLRLVTPPQSDLQATFYSSVYPNCASPSSNTQYALPDFASLTPDASTPARCVNALDYQVNNHPLTDLAAAGDSRTICWNLLADCIQSYILRLLWLSVREHVVRWLLC